MVEQPLNNQHTHGHEKLIREIMKKKNPLAFNRRNFTEIGARKIIAFGTQVIRHTPLIGSIYRDKRIEQQEEKRLKEESEKNSMIDPLTGLYNRRHFGFGEENLTGIGELQREFDEAFRSGHDLSGLMIDIDDFKKYNDAYGHAEGDKVIIAVADIIRKNIRDTDIPFRYGGEEFFILSPENDIDGAKELAKRLNEEIEGIASIIGLKRTITVSIGTASYHNSPKMKDKVFSQPVNKKEDLVTLADQALYYSKYTGKNRATAGNEMTAEQYQQMKKLKEAKN